MTEPIKRAAEEYLKERAGHSISGCVKESLLPDNPVDHEAIRTWSSKQDWGHTRLPLLSDEDCVCAVRKVQWFH